jgi:hypothetical protein
LCIQNRVVVCRGEYQSSRKVKSSWNGAAIEGESPVQCFSFDDVRSVFNESACLGVQAKVGGKILLKLNIDQTPIANKYREGKMKRTLKKELKVPEIAEREDIELCVLTV